MNRKSRGKKKITFAHIYVVELSRKILKRNNKKREEKHIICQKDNVNRNIQNLKQKAAFYWKYFKYFNLRTGT